MSFVFTFQRGRRALLSIGLLTSWAGLARSAASASPGAVSDAGFQPMLARPWQGTLNPADYLVSEKLDGVRALWDGQTLRFRSGRPIAAPSWFLAALPAVALDGELWIGRRRFDALSGAVRKEVAVDAEWLGLRYQVFDLPRADGSFAERSARLATLVQAAQPPWLQAVAQSRVADSAGLQALLQAVVAGGGEGLVLHRADAVWAPGRSDAMRKLKPLPDEEGLVLGHIAGKGKYQGLMGALLLQTPDGQHFALGSGFSDALRATPPALGATVTYRYRDRTPTGLPRFASFLRVWEAE
jgi:DNA ligase-1